VPRFTADGTHTLTINVTYAGKVFSKSFDLKYLKPEPLPIGIISLLL
jgi:hypothetical protein